MVMGTYKRPRVYDPLDLEVIDLVFEAASVQIAAKHPLPSPEDESNRQARLKKLVFACAQPGSVKFDELLDKVLERASDLKGIVQPVSIGSTKGDSGERNAL